MPPKPPMKPVQPGTSSGKKRRATLRSAAWGSWKNSVSAWDVRSHRFGPGGMLVQPRVVPKPGGVKAGSAHWVIDHERSNMISIVIFLSDALASPVPQASPGSTGPVPAEPPVGAMITVVVPPVPPVVAVLPDAPPLEVPDWFCAPLAPPVPAGNPPPTSSRLLVLQASVRLAIEPSAIAIRVMIFSNMAAPQNGNEATCRAEGYRLPSGSA